MSFIIEINVVIKMASQLTATVGKPVLTAALVGGYTYYMNPTGSYMLFGKYTPGWVIAAIAAGASCFIGEIAANYIVPQIPKIENSQLASLINVGLNPSLCAASSVLATKVIAPDELSSQGWVQTAAVGAGSYLIADYVTRRYFGNPY